MTLNTLQQQFFLNAYKPLVTSKFGRQASEKHGLCPFIDGSIRREPDFEHEFPSITCICRKGKFAPRLAVGDTVAYLTVKRKFGGSMLHRRLTAVLKVFERFESHELAADWYRSRGFVVPNNCMVSDNPPKPLEESHMLNPGRRRKSGDILLRIWDDEYQQRASQFGTFLICKPIFRRLSWDAPIVNDDHLLQAFRRIPGTQNPKPENPADFRRFLNFFEIS